MVWDILSGSCKNVLEGHSGEVLSVVLTRRGRFAVTGSMDGTARVWDLAAGSAHLQRAHAGRVHGLIATPNGTSVISYGTLSAGYNNRMKSAVLLITLYLPRKALSCPTIFLHDLLL